MGLAPITLDRVPIGVRRGSAPSPLDDQEDSKPYLPRPPAPRLVCELRRTGRRRRRSLEEEVRGIQKVFRWLSESAYLVSVPFIVILLLGTVLKSRHLALFGATFVVLLNLGRLVAGIANLAMLPLRDGFSAVHGKSARRVVEPVITIALVLLAFTFIPWLSGSKAGKGGSPTVSVAVPRSLRATSKENSAKSSTRPRTSTSESSAPRPSQGLESQPSAKPPAGGPRGNRHA